MICIAKKSNFNWIKVFQTGQFKIVYLELEYSHDFN